MDNFEVEGNELDQYLHSNSHSAGGRGSGLPPPPPYIPSNSTSSPSLAAAQAWATYKMSSTASGQLQRMAQTGGPGGGPQPGAGADTPGSPGNTSATAGTGDIGHHPHTGTTPTAIHHTNIPNSESYQQQQQDSEDNSPHSIKMEQSGLSVHFARDKYAFDMQANTSRFPFASLNPEGNDMDYGLSPDAAGQYYAQSSAMYSATGPVSPYQCMASGIRSLYPNPATATPQVAVSPINTATQWDRFTRPWFILHRRHVLDLVSICNLFISLWTRQRYAKISTKMERKRERTLPTLISAGLS